MEFTKIKIKRNIALFKIASFFDGFWPLSPLVVVYFEQITNSYAYAMGIFSISNIVQSLLEIPTGVISDKLGRKKTLCSSSFLFVLCFILYALAGNFGLTILLIIGAFFWGVAMALQSGTNEAMIYETMEQLKRSSKYDILFSQVGMFSQIGLASGAILATFVTYFYSLNVLAWVCVVPMFLHFVVTLLYIEPQKIAETKKENSIMYFFEAIKKIKSNPKLQKIAMLQIFDKCSGFSAHSIEGAFFDTLIPTYAVNIVRTIKQISGATSFYIVKYVRKFGLFKLLIASNVGNIFVRSLGLLLNNFVSPFIMALVNLFYGVSTTSQSTLVQKELSKSERATMTSIISMGEGVFLAIFYYFVGFLIDIFSLYTTMCCLIFIKIVVTVGYYFMLKKYK